jgi:hypothetical protein
MKTRLCVVLVALVTLVISAELLIACGEKFLVPNRGSRSQRPGAPRNPAGILIYDTGSELQKAFKGTSLKDTLSKAGFRPIAATTGDEFNTQLRAGGIDAVLVGIAEASTVSGRIRGNGQSAVVIPVTFQATDAQVKESRKQFPVVLRLPAKDKAFLAAIDKALEHKPKPTTSH